MLEANSLNSNECQFLNGFDRLPMWPSEPFSSHACTTRLIRATSWPCWPLECCGNNPRHWWRTCPIARRRSCEPAYLDLYGGASNPVARNSNAWCPRVRIRSMIVLPYLKDVHDLSDEAMLERRSDPSNVQYFSGIAYFKPRLRYATPPRWRGGVRRALQHPLVAAHDREDGSELFFLCHRSHPPCLVVGLSPNWPRKQ